MTSSKKTEANIFELASRLDLKFPNPVGGGTLSVAHLWKLNLVDLQKLAESIEKALQETSSKKSYFGAPAVGDIEEAKHEVYQLQFDIVMHIGTTLKAEEDARVARQKQDALNASRKARVFELINKKQDEALDKKIDELLSSGEYNLDSILEELS